MFLIRKKVKSGGSFIQADKFSGFVSPGSFLKKIQVIHFKMFQNYSGMNLLIRLLLVAGFFVGSCKNSAENLKNRNNEAQVQAIEVTVTENPDNEDMKRGQNVYNQACLVCHQVDGSGVPMMYPPVHESEIISGGHEKLIKLVLEGMSGPVEIKGEQYNSIMPPQKDILNDQQISDLLTFLRHSFGNSADAISPEEVARIRK